MSTRTGFDAIVVGAGPVGLASALALAESGLAVAAVVPPTGAAPDPGDNRTAALFPEAIALTANFGIWDACRKAAEPLRGVRIVDGSGALLRAPEVLFRPEEIGCDDFGSNVPNAVLTAALAKAAEAHSSIRLFPSAGARSLDLSHSIAKVHLAEATIVSGPLVVGADGRNSLCRGSAGIAVRTWSYDQAAVTCSLSHGRGHEGISTEIHTSAGPLTVVPLPGHASSLVWVERPAEARRLLGLETDAFRAALEARLEGLLGTLGEISPRRLFPLAGLIASPMAARRVALVGEAAHVIPPIGAQGLNLGLRDVAALAVTIGKAKSAGEDIGSTNTLELYEAARAQDVMLRTWTVDLLNRSLLLSDYLPLHLARGLGLLALATFGPLRRRVVSEGLSPTFAPRAARDERRAAATLSPPASP